MVFETENIIPPWEQYIREIPLWRRCGITVHYLLETSGITGISEKKKEEHNKKIQEKLAADGKKAEKITARQKELEDELRLIGQALEVYER